MVNTILARRVNHIVAKGGNPVWPKGSKSRGFSTGISDTEPVFTVNVGAQWNFLKDKASLSLNCADLFDTMRMKVRNRYAGQHIDLNMGQYSRTVSVKFVYRFGGSISKEKKEVDSSRFGR